MSKPLFYGCCIVLCLLTVPTARGWGFMAHKQINRLAVFGLPIEMLPFYKQHIAYITENAVNPDRRRYAVPGEAARHYIDLEAYGDSALWHLPYLWKQAVERYTADTLHAHGIVPWAILQVKYQLTEAFRRKDKKRILALSADLGHYVADCHVPLHTTRNYDGQLTGQRGIHALWEGRLPELFARNYDFWLGQAHYMLHPAQQVWQAIAQAHTAVDSVLQLERELTARFPADKKYSFETKGGITQRVYAQAFANAYHQRLQGQVERQMRASVRMVRDMWYTCWVDAGQPDLTHLPDEMPAETLPADSLHPQPPLQQLDSIQIRPHETESGYVLPWMKNSVLHTKEENHENPFCLSDTPGRCLYHHPRTHCVHRPHGTGCTYVHRVVYASCGTVTSGAGTMWPGKQRRRRASHCPAAA